MRNRNMLVFLAFALFFTLSTVSIASAQVDPHKIEAVCGSTQSNLACNVNAIFECQVDVNVQNAIVNSVEMTIEGRVREATCVGCVVAADTQDATWRVTLPNLGYGDNIRLDAVTVRSSGSPDMPSTCSASQNFGDQVPGCRIVFNQRQISNACACEQTETISASDIFNRVTVTRTPGPGCLDQTPLSYPDFGDYCDPLWTLQDSACINGETEKQYTELNPSCCAATSAGAGYTDFNHLTGSDCVPPIDQGQKVSCDLVPRVSMAETHAHENIFAESNVFSFDNNRNLLQQFSGVGTFEPLQWDIGNTGYTDIVAFSSNTIRVFQSNTLQERASLSIAGEITGQPAFAGVFSSNVARRIGVDSSLYEMHEDIYNGDAYPLLVVPVDLGVGGYAVRVYEFQATGNLNLLHSRTIVDGRISGVACIGYECYFMAGDGSVYRYKVDSNIIFSPTDVNVFWDGQEFSQISSQYRAFEGYTPSVHSIRIPEQGQVPTSVCVGLSFTSQACKDNVDGYIVNVIKGTASFTGWIGYDFVSRSASTVAGWFGYDFDPQIFTYAYYPQIDSAEAFDSLFLVWVMRDEKSMSLDNHDNLHVILTNHIGNQVYNVYKVKPSQLALTAEQFTNPNLVGPPSPAAVNLDIKGSPVSLNDALYIPLEGRVNINGVDVLSLSVARVPLNNIDSLPTLNVFPEYFATNFWIGEESTQSGEGISNLATIFDRSQSSAQITARPVVKISTRSASFNTISEPIDVEFPTQTYNYVPAVTLLSPADMPYSGLFIVHSLSSTLHVWNTVDNTRSSASINPGQFVNSISIYEPGASFNGLFAYATTSTTSGLFRLYRYSNIFDPTQGTLLAQFINSPGGTINVLGIDSDGNTVIAYRSLVDGANSAINVYDINGNLIHNIENLGFLAHGSGSIGHRRHFIARGTMYSECVLLFTNVIAKCDYSEFELLQNEIPNLGAFNRDFTNPKYVDPNGRLVTINGVFPLQAIQSIGSCQMFFPFMFNSVNHIQGLTRDGYSYSICDLSNPNAPLQTNYPEFKLLSWMQNSLPYPQIPFLRIRYDGSLTYSMTVLGCRWDEPGCPYSASGGRRIAHFYVNGTEFVQASEQVGEIGSSTQVFEITPGMLKSNIFSKSFEPVSKISAAFVMSQNVASILTPEGIYSPRLQTKFQPMQFGTGSQFVYATDLSGLGSVDLVSVGTQTLQTWISQPEVRAIVEGSTEIINHRCTVPTTGGRVSVGAFLQVPVITDEYQAYNACILPGDGSGFQCTSDWKGDLRHTYRQSGKYNMVLQLQSFVQGQSVTRSVSCEVEVFIPESLQTQKTPCSLGIDGEFNYADSITSRGWNIRSGSTNIAPSNGRLNVQSGTSAAYRLKDCDFAFMSFEFKLTPTSGRTVIESVQGDSFGLVFDGASTTQRSIRSATSGALLVPYPSVSGDIIVVLEVDNDAQIMRARVQGETIWTQEFNEFTPRDILITQGSYEYVRTQVSGTRKPVEVAVSMPSGLTGNVALLSQCSENANRTYVALQAYCSTTTTASGAPKGFCDYQELQAINKVDTKCTKEAYNYCVYQAYRRENEIPSHVNQTTSSIAAGTTCSAILGTASAWDRVAVPSVTIIWDAVTSNPIVFLFIVGLIIVSGTVFARRS